MRTGLAKDQRGGARYDFEGVVRTYSQMFGPATCGCVWHAQVEWELMTYALREKFGGTRRGQPGCPICRGEGIDPRIPVVVTTGIEDTEIPAFLVGAVLAAAIQADMG